MAASTFSGSTASQPAEPLHLWVLNIGKIIGLPDLDHLDAFVVRRFEVLEDLHVALDLSSPHCLMLIGCGELGRTIRALRDRAPETAVVVWSPERDKIQVAQALAAGAQIFSTDTRAEVLAPRLRDAVARQQRSAGRWDHIEVRLASLERERERFTSLVRSVATALDRDLVALLGHLDQAFDHLPEPSSLSDHLDLIDECGSRASELAQELAAYTGSRRIVPEPFDVSELAEDMQVLLRACLAPRFELTLNPGFNLPLVEADRALMRRMVVDLVLLVAQAPGTDHGTLTLSTGARECDRELLADIRGGDGMRTGRFVYVEASVDLAPGVEHTLDPRELEPLGGLEAVLREHYGGLRLVRRADQRLGAQAFLPAFDRSAEDETPIAKGWHDGGCILLVEPNELAKASVLPTLERLGFEVETASDGTQALEQLDRRREREDGDQTFKLVIVDADLSRPNSERVIAKMLELDPDTRILVSSGRGEAEVMSDFEGLAVRGFIRKPFRVVHLRRIFRQALEFNEQRSNNET